MNMRLPAVFLSVLSAVALIYLLIAAPIVHGVERRIPLAEETTANPTRGRPDWIEPAEAQKGAFSFLSMRSADQSSRAASWHIECVDCPKWFGYITESSLQWTLRTTRT